MPKTPEQHRQMAQLLRKAGNERQHDLIALAMEQRRRSVDEAAQARQSELPRSDS